MSDDPGPFDAANFVRTLLQLTAPSALEAHEAAERASLELERKYPGSREAIQAILFPPGEPSILVQLRALTKAKIRRPLIAAVRKAADETAWYSTEESAQLTTLADTLDRDTLGEGEAEQQAAMLGLTSVPGSDWWDLTPDDVTGLSRHGIIGERCVAVYQYLARHIPPQRQQRLGQQGSTVKYNQRALQYTAILVSGAYGWYGLRRRTAGDVKGHVSRRPH